ncbi:MAG TPA: hypothetical protein VGM77_12815 [Gemmatimonadales bacterium]|jgi:hypothetical protein
MDILSTTRHAVAITVATSALMASGVTANHRSATNGRPVSMSPNLPADFPLAPGLKACKPNPGTGPETLCEWHNVNGHAIYLFYKTALPKAGYTILKGANEVTTPHEMAGIGFKKGNIEGAVSVSGTDLTIQAIDKRAK